MARDVIDTEYGDERPTIALRANSVRQKARWEQAVQESGEYGSVSHLLRRAVERELAGANDPRESTQTDTGGGMSDEQFAQLTEAVTRIESEIEDINERVGRVENHAFSDDGLPDEILTDLYEKLPVGSEYVGSEPARAENLIRRVDYPDNEAHFGFEQLYDDISSVKRERGEDGKMYYYRGE